MMDKDISRLGEQDFDRYLEEAVDQAPPEELTNDFKPWRKAMNRILWGTGLTTLTLNFWELDLILPMIGMILLVLGFRAFRRENKWFRIAYITSCFRMIERLLSFAIHFTVYAGEPEVKACLPAVTYVVLGLVFLTLVGLRNGVRGIQTKVGLPAHGGNGLLVWYLIITALGFINYSGIASWGLLIAYGLILRNLCKLSQELDEAGYAVSPAPVKISDRAVMAIYAAVIVLSMVIGYSFFNKYPMDWQPIEHSADPSVQEVRQELLALGFPENILDDMTDEEILACDGAVFVLVDQRDRDVDRNRYIGTQEEIDAGAVSFITDEEGERQLRTTEVVVQFGEEWERLKIIHHFEWLVDRSFCGTEAIRVWPYTHNDWEVTSDFTGRLLCDLDGSTYTSSYHSIGKIPYETAVSAFPQLGEYAPDQALATFSMPDQGIRKRGYVMYDLSVLTNSGIISSYLYYTHQNSQFQFPVQTALDYDLANSYYSGRTFRTLETWIQFYTRKEHPELL